MAVRQVVVDRLNRAFQRALEVLELLIVRLVEIEGKLVDWFEYLSAIMLKFFDDELMVLLHFFLKETT